MATMRLESECEETGSTCSTTVGSALDAPACCILGDGEPKVKGSAFCLDHKRVANNLYNQVKKDTEGKGAEWDEFKALVKRADPSFLSMVAAATTSKKGKGNGSATQKFAALQFLREQAFIQRATSGQKKVWGAPQVNRYPTCRSADFGFVCEFQFP